LFAPGLIEALTPPAFKALIEVFCKGSQTVQKVVLKSFCRLVHKDTLPEGSQWRLKRVLKSVDPKGKLSTVLVEFFTTKG